MKAKRKAKAGDCDTPAVSASDTKNACGVDWFTGTQKHPGLLSAVRAIDETLDLVASTKCIGEERSIQGFQGNEICNGYGFIGRRGFETLLNLPGQAMAYIRQRIDEYQIMCNLEDWKCTRIDTAIDTTDASITPKLFWQHYLAGVVTCKADEARTIETFKRDGRHSMTVYVGSNQSTRMARIYDKRMEKEFKTGVVHPTPLTRFELQCRHEAAEKTHAFVCHEGIAVLPRLFNGWLTVRTLTGRTEIKKREQADWWTELVGGEKYLALDPRAATPEKTLAWLESEGVARAMKLARIYGKADALEHAIDEADPTEKQYQRWKEKYGEKAAESNRNAGINAIKGR